MITQPTVLILGAGASKPYGYPSGRELLNIIRRDLVPGMESELKTRLVRLGLKRGPIDDFRQELGFADPDSVDAFLENRPEFLDLGKLVIAFCLIPYEKANVFFGTKGSDREPSCWYSYLIRSMYVRNFKEFKDNELSIITFNYDRSLEHYLFTVLKHRYNVLAPECADALKHIPIIHVHGKLGNLPWQVTKPHREYGLTEDLEVIRTASQHILVMSEKEDHSQLFDLVAGLLGRAEKAYFLGFGYHETNLRRLQIHQYANKLKMFGTSFGLGTAEWRSISDKWRITFAGDGIDILSLFRDHYPI
jgi:hypothetical protein